MVSLFKKKKRFLLHILFPPRCFICKKEGSSLCENCLLSLKQPIDTPHAWIQPLYSYKDIRVKRLIHAIKFFHRFDLIQPLLTEGLSIVENVTRENAPEWCIIPIPMHPLRKIVRGYNQSEEMGKVVGSLSGIAYDQDNLKRRAYAKRQVKTKSRHERLSNQKNIFTIISPLTYTHIILIDDVTTTGATLKEARKILLCAGAVEVRAITIAH